MSSREWPRQCRQKVADRAAWQTASVQLAIGRDTTPPVAAAAAAEAVLSLVSAAGANSLAKHRRSTRRRTLCLAVVAKSTEATVPAPDLGRRTTGKRQRSRRNTAWPGT